VRSNSLTVPAVGGAIQILSDHMPLVSVLEKGENLLHLRKEEMKHSRLIMELLR